MSIDESGPSKQPERKRRCVMKCRRIATSGPNKLYCDRCWLEEKSRRYRDHSLDLTKEIKSRYNKVKK